jgi:ethanolamine utilization protein EutN
MLLARVIGRIDAARRVAAIDPFRLELLETLDAGGAGTGRRYVAIDSLGAAPGQLVVTTSAAAARMLQGLDGIPVDLAVVAVLDRPEVPA